MLTSLTQLPEYVFRGTTYNFPGGSNSTSIPYRCYTSVNPAKACLFAIACQKNYSEQPVVYVARTKSLVDAGIKVIRSIDALALIEEEIIWVAKPQNFYKYCIGYITLKDMRDALDKIGCPLNHSPNHTELSNACYETRELTVNEIGKLILILESHIKYP